MKYKSGDIVRIVGDHTEHGFPVGSIAIVESLDSEGKVSKISIGDDFRHVVESDIAPAVELIDPT
jgi:hypothetical protein